MSTPTHNEPTQCNVLISNSSSDKYQKSNRRPVEVKVTRIYPPQTKLTDINNNRTRFFVHPVNPPDQPNSCSSNCANSSILHSILNMDLPMISLCFAALQVGLYLSRGLLGVTNEEVVYASWKTVVTKGEAWRLLIAQFFHFGKMHIFFNLVTLMGIGRSLEKKIKKPAFAVTIMVMSIVSNMLYIFISDTMCSGSHNDYTVGFNTVMVSLKLIHIFTMDSEANNGKGDPNLIFGFLPVHLPYYISPWQPVIEAVFFDIFVIERCIASTISGMLSGFLFPYVMRNFRSYVMIPRNLPPPPKLTPRRRSNRDANNNDETDDSQSDTSVDDDYSENQSHRD